MSEESKDYFGIEDLKPAPDSKLNEEKTEEADAKPAEKTKAKLTFSVKQVILIVLVAVIAAGAVSLTIVSFVKDVNPISYISGEIHQAKLVNKWQSQDAPGLSAYEFFEDGTYKSYISTFSFSGNYTVQGDVLTLTNPNTSQNVVYRYKISGDTLTMTLTEENGTSFSDREPIKFDRVDMFNQKSISDIIDNLQEDNTTEVVTEAETTE